MMIAPCRVTRHAWDRSEMESVPKLVQRELSLLERRSEMEAAIRTVRRGLGIFGQNLSTWVLRGELPLFEAAGSSICSSRCPKAVRGRTTAAWLFDRV